MNILVINWLDIRNPASGGAEIYVFEIFSRIVAKGHNVTLLTSSFPGGARREVIQDIEVIRIGGRNSFNLAVMIELKKVLREKKYDIVLDDINKIPFYTPSWVKLPTMALVMHLFRRSIFKEVMFPLGAYVYITESLIPVGYRNTNFAVLSDSSRKDLVLLGVPVDKIWVISPCVDLSRCKPSAPPKGTPLIAHVGRLKRYKSVDHLLYASKKLRNRGIDFQVAILGGGDDLPRLKKISKELGLEQCVRFLGFVPEEEKIRTYHSATLVVENSVKEGWGIIVIEANACGVPVIAANSPGLVDSVVDGETGLLYKYGDIDDLANKIELLLVRKDKRKKMAEKAVEWANRFSWDEAANRMLSLITHTIKQLGDRELA